MVDNEIVKLEEDYMFDGFELDNGLLYNEFGYYYGGGFEFYLEYFRFQLGVLCCIIKLLFEIFLVFN